jgi:hypothetical protein
MSDKIKFYSNGTDKIISKDDIESVTIKESNSFSKDELVINMMTNKSYDIRENVSDFMKHFDRSILIYSSGKNIYLIARHIDGVVRIENNSFSKDKLSINMRSGKSYLIHQNLSDFEKKI